jgi:sulfur relay (sulfurtransferase) DsrC/TusE family protein
MPRLLVKKRTIEVDLNMCFESRDDWTPEIFQDMMEVNGLDYTPRHLEIAECLRSLNGECSDLLALLKALSDKGMSWCELVEAYPGGHRMALRMSGLKISRGM